MSDSTTLRAVGVDIAIVTECDNAVMREMREFGEELLAAAEAAHKAGHRLGEDWIDKRLETSRIRNRKHHLNLGWGTYRAGIERGENKGGPDDLTPLPMYRATPTPFRRP